MAGMVADSSFFLAFNAWEQPLQFRLPGPKWGGPWRVVVDTSDEQAGRETGPGQAGKHGAVAGPPLSSCWSCTSRG